MANLLRSVVEDVLRPGAAVVAALERLQSLPPRDPPRTSIDLTREVKATRAMIRLAAAEFIGPAERLQAVAPHLAPLVARARAAVLESGIGQEWRPSYPLVLEEESWPVREALGDLARAAGIDAKSVSPRVVASPAPIESVEASLPAPIRVEIGTDDEGFLVVDRKRVKGPKDAFMRAAPPHQRQHALSLLALADGGRDIWMTMRDYSEVNGLALPFKLVPAGGVPPKGRAKVRVVVAALDPGLPPPKLFRVSPA